MFESCFNTDGIGWKKLRKMRREIFGGKCPYTDQSCLSFDCENCNVEEYENKKLLEYLKEIEKDPDGGAE